MTLLVLYLFLALGVSFLCSILEAVLLSLTPAFVALQAEKGGMRGERLRQFKEHIDHPLAAILSLNTIAHTVGAAGVGAQAEQIFGSTAVGIVSAILTFLILVFSEIIPKTLGTAYWERLAPRSVWLLTGIVWLMWPLVKLSQLLTRLLTRRRQGARVEREQLSALARVGEREGSLEHTESSVVQNLLRLRALRIRDVMTPRVVLFELAESCRVGDVLEQVEESPFSRIPVYTESREDVSGYVLRSDVLLAAARDEHARTLDSLKRPILKLPDGLSLAALLDQLLASAGHVALVIDEYGGVAGLVTLEDAVETLLGLEIVDEQDTDADMRDLARRKWRQRAQRAGLIETPGGDPAPNRPEETQ